MKIIFLSAFICGAAFICCKSKQHKLTETIDSIANTRHPEEYGSLVIRLKETAGDSIKRQLESFPSLANVLRLSQIAIDAKDSLMNARDRQPLHSEDSLMLRPMIADAHKAILDYKIEMFDGRLRLDHVPNVLSLQRELTSNDATAHWLPAIEKKSAFFMSRKYFFLGGSPLLHRFRPDDSVFFDPNGRPEARFSCALTENNKFLLTSVMANKNPVVDITFGPALNSYDLGPHDISGIGTLNHQFTKRIPVYFITESGIVKGYLIAIDVKLVPENLGCVSDLPLVWFACPKNLSERQILGVYIPFDANGIEELEIIRLGKKVWTADFDHDGVPEMACVFDTFEGMASGSLLSEAVWFINADGVWQIIDWGTDFDCT